MPIFLSRSISIYLTLLVRPSRFCTVYFTQKMSGSYVSMSICTSGASRFCSLHPSPATDSSYPSVLSVATSSSSSRSGQSTQKLPTYHSVHYFLYLIFHLGTTFILPTTAAAVPIRYSNQMLVFLLLLTQLTAAVLPYCRIVVLSYVCMIPGSLGDGDGPHAAPQARRGEAGVGKDQGRGGWAD